MTDAKQSPFSSAAGERANRVRPLAVRKVVPVPYASCSVRTPDRVQWSTDMLDELIPEIWKSNASVIKVHCHPGGYDRFSEVDDVSDQELATSFDGLFEEGRMHGSLILLPDGSLFGRTLQYGSIGDDLRSILVVGNNIDVWSRKMSNSAKMIGGHSRHSERAPSERLALCRSQLSDVPALAAS